MNLQTRKADDGKTITIHTPEEFDFKFHKELRDIYIDENLGASYILDLSKTSYIDSSALGMLLLMRDTVTRNGGTVKIINCRSRIMNLFIMSNFHRLFDVA